MENYSKILNDSYNFSSRFCLRKYHVYTIINTNFTKKHYVAALKNLYCGSSIIYGTLLEIKLSNRFENKRGI